MNTMLNKISVVAALIISTTHLCSPAAVAEDADPFKDKGAALVDCRLPTARMRKDAKIYSEEYLGVFVDIPDSYENRRITLVPHPPTQPGVDPIKIKVKKSGYVYCVVAYGKGIAQLEKLGWAVILRKGFTYHHHKTRNLVVLKKYYDKGEYEIPSVVGIGTRILIK